MVQADMKKVISYVNTNRGNGHKQSLERLFCLLEILGNPQSASTYIHTTGTNGKGSTSSMMASVLRKSGLDVGLFTSPHLEIVNERIRINDDLISDEDFTRMVNVIEPEVLRLEAEMGEKFYAFELLTVVAFMYFQEKKPDIVILEAGIGGRLDSTNVITTPEVALITSIGVDHKATLGNTKQLITYEKSFLLKEDGDMVVGPIEASLHSIITERAEALHGHVTFVDTTDISINETTTEYQVFSYKMLKNLKLGFLGRHQVENACLVLEACAVLKEKGYKITDEDIKKGLADAYWPGRFEKMMDHPLFYIDGAHNVASVTRLVETLEKDFAAKKFHFVIGMMADKDYQMMIEQVKHLAKTFILISPDQARGFNPETAGAELRAEGFQVVVKDNAADVLSYIKAEIPQEEIVMQFGSLYLVGDIKRLFH